MWIVLNIFGGVKEHINKQTKKNPGRFRYQVIPPKWVYSVINLKYTTKQVFNYM